MKIEKRIVVTLLLLTASTPALSADEGSKAPAEAATQTRECNSCTLRHQALLKKKKQRENKARKDAEAAKSKTEQ